jgi:molecular chaperone DnaJ
MPEKRDYYEILGVHRTASQDEIKRAYRRLARKYHPDVNHGDTEAEERFKEINEAYEILSDEEKRERYDRFGHAGVYGAPGPGDFGFGDFGGFGDIFDIFFGSGQSRTTRETTSAERGSDLRFDLDLTLEEAAVGVEKDIRITHFERCDACSGSGAAAGSRPETCPTCRGSGQVRQRQQTFLGVQISISTCPNCRGEGRVISHPCGECGGSGRVRKTVNISVKIPAGVDDGSRIRITGAGDAGYRGGASGDLYIITHIKPHAIFERKGNDIWCEIPIAFTQAALGATIKVRTLTGEETLNIDKGTQTGDVYTLHGKGMPDVHGRGQGDMNVVIKVEVPKNLTEEQRQLLRRLAELRGEQVEGAGEKGLFEKVKDALGGR